MSLEWNGADPEETRWAMGYMADSGGSWVIAGRGEVSHDALQAASRSKRQRWARWLRAARWANRVYAWLGGYFWLPCPQCGRMFGGHECGAGHVQREGKDWRTCWRCS
jgi:hypothetical protein